MDSAAKGSADPQGDFANLDFLAQSARVETNLIIDDDGFVTIALELLGTHQHVHVMAIHPLNTVVRSYSLPERSPQILDVRLAESLPIDQHFSQQKRIDVVPIGTEFRIADVTTSRFQVYDDLAAVYQLYQSLLNDAKLAEFRFLLTWPEQRRERKLELYSHFACHELNFFLSQRDPEFFKEVVKPYLTNKSDKRFLDQWLLDGDVSGFLTLHRYQRLNTVEKALLGRRFPAERNVTSRYIREQLEILPPDVVKSLLRRGKAGKIHSLWRCGRCQVEAFH